MAKTFSQELFSVLSNNNNNNNSISNSNNKCSCNTSGYYVSGIVLTSYTYYIVKSSQQSNDIGTISPIL